MKFKKILSLFILITCLNININETNFDSTFEYLNKNLEDEIINFDILNISTEQYMRELKDQKNYIKFIENINNNYYYPLENQGISLDLELISFSNLINYTNCVSNYLLISDKQTSLLCINNLYNSLSLFNITTKKEIFEIPILINLNFSKSIKVSFSAFDEEETKILIFNNERIYSIHLQLNYSLTSFKISYINNFTISNYSDEKLIHISSALYHGNRYAIYGYNNGECQVYLLRDKLNDSCVSARTIFKLNQQIFKIYQTQGYLFIIEENGKKIRILSLLGSNSVLVNCYCFNKIIDIIFDYKNNLLYILDNKGTIIIKELTLSVSKAYTNTCNSIYSLQIPNFIIKNQKNSDETLKLIISKTTNLVYILGKNYLGYINDKYELENYIIYNRNNNNNLIYDDNILFSKGNIHFLISNYNKHAMIYKIKPIKKENLINIKSKDKKDKIIYNIIDDNSGIVECNGNNICKLLFNSFTNNKYTINTLYLTCLIIIISSVYYYRKNTSKNKNYKSFKEDDLNNNNEEKGYKFSKMFEKMKNLKNFEMFSEYKKRQREKNNNNRQEEEYKDYYGDEDDNNDINEKEKEENEEEFLSKAYRNYVNDMMKKKMKEDDEDNEDEDENYEDDEYDDNYIENNEGNNQNKFEERKGLSSNDD